MSDEIGNSEKFESVETAHAWWRLSLDSWAVLLALAAGGAGEAAHIEFGEVVRGRR